jgi:4-hydroxythreonine-4-phosphate dehydrogenase
MMLATKTLRVALATTHLPLRAVADAITKERLHQVIDILIQDLKANLKLSIHDFSMWLKSTCRGRWLFGHEEIEVINPVLKATVLKA